MCGLIYFTSSHSSSCSCYARTWGCCYSRGAIRPHVCRRPSGPTSLPMTVYNVTWSTKYDDKNGDTEKVACSSLAHRYPHFKNFPTSHYIGGAFNITKQLQRVLEISVREGQEIDLYYRYRQRHKPRFQHLKAGFQCIEQWTDEQDFAGRSHT